jgi:hypothetical protein
MISKTLSQILTIIWVFLFFIAVAMMIFYNINSDKLKDTALENWKRINLISSVFVFGTLGIGLFFQFMRNPDAFMNNCLMLQINNYNDGKRFEMIIGVATIPHIRDDIFYQRFH